MSSQPTIGDAMRIAILSDIHANLEALQAVALAIAEEHVDRVGCLGDIVGYNADPDECVDLLFRLDPAVVAGNHDRAVTGQITTEGSSRTRRGRWPGRGARLPAETLDFLAGLPLRATVGGELVAVHGALHPETGCETVSSTRTSAGASASRRSPPTRPDPRLRLRAHAPARDLQSSDGAMRSLGGDEEAPAGRRPLPRQLGNGRAAEDRRPAGHLPSPRHRPPVGRAAERALRRRGGAAQDARGGSPAPLLVHPRAYPGVAQAGVAALRARARDGTARRLTPAPCAARVFSPQAREQALPGAPSWTAGRRPAVMGRGLAREGSRQRSARGHRAWPLGGRQRGWAALAACTAPSLPSHATGTSMGS